MLRLQVALFLAFLLPLISKCDDSVTIVSPVGSFSTNIPILPVVVSFMNDDTFNYSKIILVTMQDITQTNTLVSNSTSIGYTPMGQTTVNLDLTSVNFVANPEVNILAQLIDSFIFSAGSTNDNANVNQNFTVISPPSPSDSPTDSPTSSPSLSPTSSSSPTPSPSESPTSAPVAGSTPAVTKSPTQAAASSNNNQGETQGERATTSSILAGCFLLAMVPCIVLAIIINRRRARAKDEALLKDPEKLAKELDFLQVESRRKPSEPTVQEESMAVQRGSVYYEQKE
jgi:hypothetical protein